MNFTGNPRHLRSHPRPRSVSKGYFRRHRAISERPQVAICQGFQDQSPDTGSEAKSLSHISRSDQETFETKRRRLLHQTDWLGLDISVPINVSFLAFAYFLITKDIRYTECQGTKTPC
jgi:hypothetical protein